MKINENKNNFKEVMMDSVSLKLFLILQSTSLERNAYKNFQNQQTSYQWA